MNQTLEVALQAFIGPERDNWRKLLDGFRLAYNTSVHSVTGFTPAFLLFGFHPKTKTGFISPRTEELDRPNFHQEIEYTDLETGKEAEGIQSKNLALEEVNTGPDNQLYLHISHNNLQGWSLSADELSEQFKAI